MNMYNVYDFRLRLYEIKIIKEKTPAHRRIKEKKFSAPVTVAPISLPPRNQEHGLWRETPLFLLLEPLAETNGFWPCFVRPKGKDKDLFPLSLFSLSQNR